MSQGRDVGLQLPTFPVTEPTCWPEEGLIWQSADGNAHREGL